MWFGKSAGGLPNDGEIRMDVNSFFNIVQHFVISFLFDSICIDTVVILAHLIDTVAILAHPMNSVCSYIGSYYQYTPIEYMES